MATLSMVTTKVSRADQGSAKRRRRALATMALVLVVVAGGGAAIAAWVESQRRQDHETATDLDMSRVGNRLQRIIERTTAGLAGAPAIVDQGTPSTERFTAFIEGISQVDPVIVAALELAVTHDERAVFETDYGVTIRHDLNLPDPAPQRDRYYPVIAVYPNDDGAGTMVGLDIGGDAVRGNAAGIARDTGRAAITPPVDLPYSAERGIIVVQPLYRNGGADTIDERRALLVGFISISYSIDTMVTEALEPTTMLRHVEVLDGTAEAPPLPAGWEERTIALGGQTWLVRAWPVAEGSNWAALAIVAVSLLVTGLLIEMIRRAWRYDLDLAASNDSLRVQQQRLVDLQSLTATLASAATVPDVVKATLDEGLPLINAMAGEFQVTDEEGNVIEAAGGGLTGLPDELTHTRQLVAEGRQLGQLTVTFQPTTDPEPAQQMLNAVATMSGLAVARALRYDTEHQMVSALQAMLLPVLPTRWGSIQLAAKYQPMMTTSGVGGDWYDLLDTPNGPAVVIGDVVGKGFRAAGVMGQLRIATRTMSDRYDPAAVLGALDELTSEFRSAWMTSMAYVVLDVDRSEIRVGIAGHPPPLLLRPDRPPVWLDTAVGPPLGVYLGAPSRTTMVTPMRDGDRLLLYTDGLIERRGETIDVGLARLKDLASSLAGVPAADFVDQLVLELSPPGEQQDDVAVLCADLAT